ncbi:hypothetical protein HPB49_010930 [Dermacentor silvarum]|uniref:Uncharacterized protein n=1 Tax=Dermacentor silvarum TaxID=543639 RepID=A0ACB8DYR7_DERSI|nr:hypothetical protein HPB49_010930 [Dermacentor silvarum]
MLDRIQGMLSMQKRSLGRRRFACSNLGGDERDEAWNPKAKLAPNCPKPLRPTREGTQKQSVKRTIEDTASKPANKPLLKRTNHRKKAQEAPEAKEMDMEESEAGPSTSSVASKKPSLPPHAFRLKKPKKGFPTPKQRLGKIVMIDMMIY